jgi:hypothetical protein
MSNISEEDPDQLVPNVGVAGGTNDLENGVIVKTEDQVELVVKLQDKEIENLEREVKLKYRDNLLKAYMRKLKQEKEQIKKDKIKLKMMSITDEMDSLREEEMNEAKFWGLLALDDDGEVFDYGRDILKEGTYET